MHPREHTLHNLSPTITTFARRTTLAIAALTHQTDEVLLVCDWSGRLSCSLSLFHLKKSRQALRRGSKKHIVTCKRLHPPE